MQIDPLGDSALIVRLPLPADDLVAVADAVAFAERLRGAQLPGIVEVAPALRTVAVFYDPTRITLQAGAASAFDEIKGAILHGLPRVPLQRRSKKQAIEIPVCYDAEFAPDLAEVARNAGLDAREVIRRHSGAAYRVSCIGFAPGFPYLSGLPAELSTPRRRTPRKQVAPGSVGIGGNQTGIYPSASPGGWNVIARTPLRLFEPTREPPSLLQPGDAVRFRPITRSEFEALIK